MKQGHGAVLAADNVLPAEAQMGTLVSTLEYGVAALDPDVVQGSLEALASLSRQHYLAACEGQPGIATPQGACRSTGPRRPHLPCACSLNLCRSGMGVGVAHTVA